MTKSCPNRTAEGWGGGRFEHKGPERLPLSEIRPVPRRGLSRVEAAMYIGISPTKFDELRTNGRISPPRLIDGRKVWDVRDLDRDFEAFAVEGGNAEEDWKASV
jgi:hypothetical protein